MSPNMQNALLLALAAGLVLARAADPCRDIDIPITVSVPRLIVTTEIRDNWDAAALTFNLTSTDFGTPALPLPLAGTTPGPVNSTYTVGATLCDTGGPMLVLTHGIIESKLYWRPNLENSEKYSFVDAAMAAGYSILSYDRIGVGSSSKINSHTDAQFQVEVAVLDRLVDYARASANATQIVLVGHSYGSYISAASAAAASAAASSSANTTSGTPGIDALILTGFSGTFAHFAPFLSGAALRVAQTLDPARWSSYPPGDEGGWLTAVDVYASTYGYFGPRADGDGNGNFFERRVAEWSHKVAGQPFAVGELPSLLNATIAYADVAAPVLMLQGRYDVSACGGECVGVVRGFAEGNFTGARAVEVVEDLPAGHNLFLHEVAPKAFDMIFDFLKAQGV
ncbi:alpha/beta-hydrolase [Xylariomycetidae sp. FL2044]|nr:alpha/beta-hydrolase [Xylariomycetidae sp. FL2044]